MTAFTRTAVAAALVLAASAMAGPARAGDDCYGLWFDRNLIYAVNGYCFKTPEAQEVFADYQCWTRNPQLNPQEQREVASIQAEEKALGCR